MTLKMKVKAKNEKNWICAIVLEMFDSELKTELYQHGNICLRKSIHKHTRVLETKSAKQI